MKYFGRVDLTNTLIARFRPMEAVPERIMDLMSEVGFRRAAILSAIGSFSEATFYCVKPDSKLPYGAEQITKISVRGPFEVLTMEGNILPSSDRLIQHLHVALGTHDGRVVGGHLERATVYTTLELFLAEIKGCNVEKRDDKIAGGIQIKLPIK
ncbi:MAG: DNA-binding protein [Candidatus Bathyarchaeia archaeon]|nr:DNA-binding protein [Candidatus Bathyarchaeota archaeon]